MPISRPSSPHTRSRDDSSPSSSMCSVCHFLCLSRFLLPFPELSFLPFLFSALGQALDLLVTVSYIRYRTSTSVLSTSCSLRGLRLATGDLILRGASRLDAFSVYPVRTWLLCHALGNTTDTPAVRPPRSSRTKGSSSQISCARAG